MSLENTYSNGGTSESGKQICNEVKLVAELAAKIYSNDSNIYSIEHAVSNAYKILDETLKEYTKRISISLQNRKL